MKPTRKKAILIKRLKQSRLKLNKTNKRVVDKNLIEDIRTLFSTNFTFN